MPAEDLHARFTRLAELAEAKGDLRLAGDLHSKAAEALRAAQGGSGADGTTTIEDLMSALDEDEDDDDEEE